MINMNTKYKNALGRSGGVSLTLPIYDSSLNTKYKNALGRSGGVSFTLPIYVYDSSPSFAARRAFAVAQFVLDARHTAP
jgi:hypothetical protein